MSNNDPRKQVVYLQKENNKIKAENIALTSTLETIIKCLSGFDHNPNIQGIGQICKKKLEEIKRGDDRTCKGKNCTAINGINHSSECMQEHDNNINGVSND